MVSVTLEGLWMVSDRIADFQFFVKFHRSGPAIIFSFWTIMEYVSYPSKKLLIKQKTSSRWWVLLWKDYGWFLIELSILDFASNFTCPDRNKFQFLNYRGACYSKMLLIKPRFVRISRWWVLLRKDYEWFLIELQILTGPDLQ